MKLRRTLFTYETVAALKTPGLFRRAYDRALADSSKLNSEFIAVGRGLWRNEDIEAAAKTGDEMSLQCLALRNEFSALCYQAKRWFNQEPYMVRP